ncbi:Rossmann-fold NAD(P)-binding domain-containing protein [Pseudoroseomonas ludipueritiae]|uniref:NAD-dependent dehydratase n=1 Tax=Pseudoroseomonas ludipueritiae TaxID=198093 RepID=A0ABR7R5C4_9PROT|nr:NAD-dependent dehydratase [Pseudoroseomonas ludipueritiae]MBC9176835.1 NAD-dependent dehydratase [Pseudoroseomonas ludipueritiae]
MRLLLVGSTGLVGQHVLGLALADPRVTEVVALARRALPEQPKLLAPLVDFERLPEDASWWRADAVICTLGTTMRAAGSQEAFRRVVKHYPLAVARLARRHGTPAYVLNSAMGADPSSRFFYNRVKGEVERELSLLGFRSLTILRPGLSGGRRQERRPAEQLGGMVLGLLAPVLPRRLRINPAASIARAMVDAAIAATPGKRIIGSAELA